MLEILGTIVGGILTGGARGLIGVALQRFADYKNKQLDIETLKIKHTNEVEMRRVDAEIMAQEWAARTKVAEVETAGASDVEESKAFAASFGMEPQRYAEGAKLTPNQTWLMVLLDFFRGAVRPALTLYLCILVTAIWIEARIQLRAEDLSNDQALELFKLVLGTIVYVWTTVTLWWFGTRNRQKQPGS